jgi:glycerol uptake facilitator protein
MSTFIAELLGTALLVLFGNGVVANVVLARTKGHGAGWIVITFGWGMAVFVAVFCVSEYSGAHLNPAVTLALAAAGKFDPAGSGKFTGWNVVPLYWAAQMLGGFVGACLVYLFHKPYFDATDDPNGKLACFCTAPNIRSYANALFCEIVGTMALILPILLMINPSLAFDLGAASKQTIPVGLGWMGALPVGLLVFAIGLSLGGTTGYAINPARDLAPRLAHALLPIRNKRDADWAYAWVPVVGPLLGALLAVGIVHLIVTRRA